MVDEINDQKIIKVFDLIGLRKNEKLVYLDLIKNGSSSALEISKRTGIHRPNTYDAIRELIGRGFVLESKDLQKTLFRAVDPERIRDYVQHVKFQIDSVIPHIKDMKMRSEKGRKEEVYISTGAFSARTALLDLLQLKREIRVYGASKAALETFGPAFLREFHKKRIRKRVVMRHIYNKNVPDRIKQLNKMKYTEAKHLSEEYDTNVSTLICGDTTILIIFSEPVSVITIRSAEIADTYKKYFKILWARAKK